MPWTLNPTTQPDQADIAAVDRGLHTHNRAHLGKGMADQFRRLAVLARDDAGAVVGGVHGWFYWEWLHVDTLWVAHPLRGQGLGSSLMQAIEALAGDHTATGIHLETTDFQHCPSTNAWATPSLANCTASLLVTPGTICRSVYVDAMRKEPSPCAA